MVQNNVFTTTREGVTAPVSRFMAAALRRHCGLDSEDAAVFEQLVAELTEALHQGHICLDLSGEQRLVMSRSPIVGEERRAPLVLSANRLYFGRYFTYESELGAALNDMAEQASGKVSTAAYSDAGMMGLIEDHDQRRAIEIALSQRFCIISGGPGTGKTTLVVAIISQLLAHGGPTLKIALAAPTGKAAIRLQDSVRTRLAEAGLHQPSGTAFPDRAMTLHRLLGIRGISGRAEYHQAEPLNYDVVVVDEASMVDLAMMWRLVTALKKGARLILLGDKDQLASVESGAVLADCIDSLAAQVAELKKSYRFNEEIARFAEAVRSGDGEAAWAIGSSPENRVVSIEGPTWLDKAIDAYRPYLTAAVAADDPAEYPALFNLYNHFQVLCAVRRGPYGAEEINRGIEMALAGTGPSSGPTHWYPGCPVLITRNDHSLGLYNGDIGLCLPDPESAGSLKLWFESADNSLRKFGPSQVSAFDKAWALTIHKAQGSEFDEVVAVLPDLDNRVLCRELLYTAITRARRRISLVTGEEVFKLAVSRKTVRYSGLAGRLA